MKSSLELLGEVVSVVARREEPVFVLDVHRPGVSHLFKDREKSLPVNRSIARNPESPPANVIDRLNSGPPQHVPKNLRVLQMDVVNLTREIASRLHRVHELPHQMRRI